MFLDESAKNDIITILEEFMDEGVPGVVYDYDPEWEYRSCRICGGYSHNMLTQDDVWRIAENRIVKHKEGCAVLLAHKLLPILKENNMSDDNDKKAIEEVVEIAEDKVEAVDAQKNWEAPRHVATKDLSFQNEPVENVLKKAIK